jgi:CAAX prenyl protease-like protein
MKLLEPLYAVALETLYGAVGLFQGRQLKPTVILLSSTILLLSWRYGCHHSLFDDPVRGAFLSFAGFFVLAGLIPALIVKLVFRERLSDYGVGLGNRGRTAGSFLVMVPLILTVAYVASHIPSIRSYYPINPNAGESPTFFGLHALSYLLFYLGWEFHFRGFMQVGLKDSMGTANAVFIQVMASTLLHIGTPGLEAYGAILGGLWWGFLVSTNRSILSGMLQHMLLGLSLDYFIAFG